MRNRLPPVAWEHGPGPGALVAACGTHAAASVAYVAGLWWAWVALAGVAATIAATHAAARTRQAGGSVAYRTACWAAASGWAAWAAATTPLAATQIWVLVAGALVGRILAPPVSRHEQAEQARAARAAAEEERGELAAEWVGRVRRVCGVTVKVIRVKEWEFLVDGAPSGFSLDVDLPPGGKTWKHLRGFTEALAGDAQLPIGCGVTVRPHKPGPNSHRGAAVIEVATADAFRGDIDYPADYSPLTVNRPLHVGVFRDGSPAGGEHRSTWDLTVGQTGSGKSNVMQVKNANFARCVDVLLWVIDRNGGGLALPWVLPWWERLGTSEEIAAPAVDWMAADIDEALRIAQVALEIARGRKTRYQQLMRRVNDDKVPVSCDLPLIFIVVDEIDTILGENSDCPQLRKALKEVQNEGRGGAVRGEFGALRAVSEMLGGVNVKRQSKYRTGMMVIDMDELAYLFGSTAGLSLEDIPEPGYGYLKFGQDSPRPFKARRLKPHQIEDIAVAVADIRPGMDKVSEEIAEAKYPGVYAGRWERIRPWLESASGGTAVATAAAGAAEVPGSLDETEVKRRLDETGRRMQERAAEVEAERARGSSPGGLSEADAARVDDIDNVLAEWSAASGPQRETPPAGTGPTPSEAGIPPNPRSPERERMLRLILAAGPAGVSPKALAVQLSTEYGRTIHRPTVDGWLGEEIALGMVRKVARGVYVHAAHLGGGDAPRT